MKISIIGRGNAGCISATHFAHYRNLVNTNIEIDLHFDSSIPPVPTGQGTTLEFPELLFEKFNIGSINDLPHTVKKGIMYENFGQKQDKIYHYFPIGRYSLHFEPKNFQDFVCKNLKINFKEIDENIKNYDEIDSDYIIDCRGAPSNFNEYEILTNPLNCALLSSLPKKENDVEYTRSIAHKNGWCFYIPLSDKTSLGYVFNENISTIDEAKKDFENTFGVKKINKIFPFKQYICKKPIIDKRVLLNGNKLFFLEPLEATAMGCYIKTTRYYFDYIFNNINEQITTYKIKDYVYKLQDFILWHYATGSKYKTKFWKYAENLWRKHDTDGIDKIIKIIQNMDDVNIEKSLHSDFEYAQWKEWNFKIWLKGTS